MSAPRIKFGKGITALLWLAALAVLAENIVLFRQNRRLQEAAAPQITAGTQLQMLSALTLDGRNVRVGFPAFGSKLLILTFSPGCPACQANQAKWMNLAKHYGIKTDAQAQLHRQVYDQRREAKLRQARDWFGKNYIVNNIDDAMRIAPMGRETGNYVGMVIGYWEQACALLNYGLLHEDLFFETSGEFFGVWEAVKPVVPAFRERFANKQILAHLEQAAKHYEAWSERRNPGHVAAMRQFMQQIRTSSSVRG